MDTNQPHHPHPPQSPTRTNPDHTTRYPSSDPDAAFKLVHDIQDALKAAAEAESEATRLDKRRKAIQAERFLRETGTVAEREALARTAPEYTNAERAWISAASQANIARAIADGLKLEWETWRTMQATRRAEMQLV